LDQLLWARDRGRYGRECQVGETSAVTSAVGGNHLPESLSGPCRCLRYHELKDALNTHKVTKSQLACDSSAERCEWVLLPPTARGTSAPRPPQGALCSSHGPGLPPRGRPSALHREPTPDPNRLILQRGCYILRGQWTCVYIMAALRMARLRAENSIGYGAGWTQILPLLLTRVARTRDT
jgi:hypothetical protein